MRKEEQIIRKAKKGKAFRQVAAVPVRRDADGRIEILLITSSTTQRFIVPKGWPMKGKSGRKAAAVEAREEAGVVGVALKKPIGTYAYWKRLSNGSSVSSSRSTCCRSPRSFPNGKRHQSASAPG